MANVIKPKRLRKKAVSFGIKQYVIDDLIDYCAANGVVKSNLVEELIINFIKEKDGRTN